MILPIIVDHKTGHHLAGYLCAALNKYFTNEFFAAKRFQDFYSKCLELINIEKNIIFVRNPKKIILSSYYYHLKCKETWCINQNNINNYITHICKPENVKNIINNFYRSDLIINSKHSFQKILQSLSELEGLKFDFFKSSIFTLHHMEILLKNFNDNKKSFIIDCDKFTNNFNFDFGRIKREIFHDLDINRISKIYKKILEKRIDVYKNHKTNSNKKNLPDVINDIYQEKFPNLDNLYNQIINKSYKIVN